MQAYGGWLQILFGHMDDIDVDFRMRKMSVQGVQRKIRNSLRVNRNRLYDKSSLAEDYEQLQAAIDAGQYIKRENKRTRKRRKTTILSLSGLRRISSRWTFPRKNTSS